MNDASRGDAYAVEELLALIHGMTLLTYEAGEVIVTEGEPGNGLRDRRRRQ